MNKKYWLVIIILCGVLVGVLFYYLNRQPIQPAPVSTPEESNEAKKGADENLQSIELEKPPFIKD